MFDIGWRVLVAIAVVALIAIGPKELPGVLRMVGQWMGKARKMAAEFQSQFQEAMREAEMADIKKSFDEVKEAASGFSKGNLLTSLQDDVTSAFGSDKPVETAVTTTETAAIEPPAEPTTPEAPHPETAVEADTHALTHARAAEPVAITSEAHTATTVEETAADNIKDAKAS